MVAWPAVIKYLEDDELRFVSSLDEFNGHPDVRNVNFNPGDVLIDTVGKVYALRNGPSPVETPQESESLMTLDSVVDLVRRHASVCGECCISKISAPTIAEAIVLVKGIGSG